MASVAIVLALFGFLSPSNRGSLPTVMVRRRNCLV